MVKSSHEQREPAIITIFGVSGDLSRRKLLPALYNLAKANIISEHTYIVGVSRRELTVDRLIDDLEEHLTSSRRKIDQHTINWLKDRLTIQVMDLDEQSDFKKLRDTLDRIEGKVSVCLSRLFYLAVPVSAFSPLVSMIGAAGLNKGCQHANVESRLLIEKPFGYDIKSAKLLIGDILKSFKEHETYRIDHYLAKETVQNILILRSQNPVLEASWGHKYIKSITIRAIESIGIENRVDFYEQTGAFRDVIQSHLMQILALITMEMPESINTDSVHRAKVSVLEQIQAPRREMMVSQSVRGQYRGYTEEVDNTESITETYASAIFSIDNDRWRGVPLKLETGKAMNEKLTEIVVEFKSRQRPEEASNILTVKIQPEDGVILDVRVKVPGFGEAVETIPVDFYYKERKSLKYPDAYERVIADALHGDRTLFATSEEVLESWRASQPILDAWADGDVQLELYEKGASSVV